MYCRLRLEVKVMTVNVLLNMNFEDGFTIHEVEDVVKTGEYFPENVTDCHIITIDNVNILPFANN